MEESFESHWEESASMIGWSLLSIAFGCLRANTCTLETEGSVRRFDRIKDPWRLSVRLRLKGLLTSANKCSWNPLPPNR